MATSILKPSCNGTSSVVDAPKPGSNCTSAVIAPAVQASNGNVHQQGDLSEPAASSPVCVQHIIGNGMSHYPNNISNGVKKVGESVSTHQNSSDSHDDKKGQPTSTEQNGNASRDDKKKGRHAGIGHKTVLQSDALYQYVLETSVYPRENPYQRELREITEKHPWNLMTTPPDEGQFLMLLMKLINAKNTMELGVYTGYSLLSTALALPDDGKIIAIDINRENYELGAPVLEKAGLSHKIDFREGFILPQLDAMLLEEKNHGFFDFVFVDADKDNYVNYHERLLKLVKLGGLIGYDNTLWNGSLVAPEDAPYPKYVRHYRPFVLELNRVLAGDKRIEISQVPIGDGITLCRRIK